MAEAKLRQEIAESRADIEKLREQMSSGRHTVHKDLSLISLVLKWSGAENATPLEEFLASIDRAALIGKWQDTDSLNIAVLCLEDPAKAFYKACTQLYTKDASWQDFKNAFRERFRDVHSDQYHFTKLQTARQAKNEGPMEFADRCKGLAQRVMSKVNDPVAQQIHRENADRTCLASIVAGLSGVVSRQVRYAHPRNLHEALNLALVVDEAEKQERLNETFYTWSDEFAGQLPRSPGKKFRGSNSSERSADSCASSQQIKQPHSTRSGTQSNSSPRCYECEGIGHFTRECPTRLKRIGNAPNLPGRKNPSEHSKRLSSPSEKPQNTTTWGGTTEKPNQGNE